MKKFLSSVFIVFLFAGCANNLREVHVPVPVKCQVVVQKPQFHFDSAKKEMTIFEKVKLLVAERLQRQAYEAELELALESCS